MGMQMFLFHGFVYPACWSRIFFVLSRFFCILFVFYESFIPFMMHCLWSKCQSSMIVCPTSVCVHYVLVAWWIPNDYNLTTCVYFIRLKLDLSCHLHVKHPLLLGFVSLRIISVAFIWENACSESGVPNVMVQGKWLLSDLSSLTKHLSLLSHFAVVGHPSWF